MTTVNKTESSKWQEKQGSMPSNDKSQDMTPHSTPTQDNGQIHQASLICRLPPEPQPHTTKMEYNQQSPEVPAPPRPSDASEGPEVVMQVIDKWFGYQDQCTQACQYDNPPH